MIDLIIATIVQATPMYLAALPIIVIGILVRTVISKQKGAIYLGNLAFMLLSASILLTLAATCYSSEFLSTFNITNLTKSGQVHFDPAGFLNNILLDSFAGSFHALVNWAGNIGLFIPIGFFAMWLSRNANLRKTRIVLLCMLFSMAIETTQLCSGRLADGVDVILNTTGAFIGCWTFDYFMAVTDDLNCKFKHQ
ncbi:glycopeptide antibiotics resistance protein [Clostridiales Family XIII bacterium PM5-7]